MKREVVQSTSFATSLMAGSLTDIQARAWSTQTGKTARLSDFVSARELPRLTNAIRKPECCDGSEIDLRASYASFPHWVPLQRGIVVWFLEYQFGCTTMSLKVYWP